MLKGKTKAAKGCDPIIKGLEHLSGKAEGTGAVQPEEVTERGPHLCVSVSAGMGQSRNQALLLVPSNGIRGKGQGLMARNFHLQTRKNFSEQVTALEQAPQRVSGVSPTGCNPVPWVSREAGPDDPPSGPFQSHPSVILGHTHTIILPDTAFAGFTITK